MSKGAQYFSHDLGARNDPKLQKVLRVLKHEGKSVFWDLVEMLYENDGKLLLSECGSYAFALRTTEKTILRLVNEFDLFKSDSVYFWSDSVNRRLTIRKEKQSSARKSAEIRWGKNANALPTHSEQDANGMLYNDKDNERIGKDNITHTQIGLPPNVSFVTEHFLEHRKDLKDPEQESFRFWNHYRAKGEVNGNGQPIVNWKALAMNWQPNRIK